MLTKEQIKNLKRGDKVLAECTFSYVRGSGDLVVSFPITDYDYDVHEMYHHVHPSCFTLPPAKPKHDLCRPFKKGDKVRYCERDGRKLFRLQDGAIYEVKSDESDAGTVEIWLWKDVGRYESYPYNVFELITPVEEFTPYSVETDQYGFHIERYDGKVLATYNDELHPDAFEAAESECERLIDEWKWKKEHESNL